MIDAVTEEVLTYGQLRKGSLRLGQGLAAKGLGKGKTILIFSPNTLLYTVLLFGGVAAGVTVSTANGSYTATELGQLPVSILYPELIINLIAHSIKLSGASIVLAYSDLLPVALEAIKLVPGLAQDNIYLLPGSDGKITKGFKNWTELNGTDSDDSFKAVKFTPKELKETVAFLPFSSGTTGMGNFLRIRRKELELMKCVGKGVAITHSNVTSVGLQLSKVEIFSHQEVVIGVLPLYRKFLRLQIVRSLLIMIRHLWIGRSPQCIDLQRIYDYFNDQI